jgi:uncharacterized protein with PIN domain
VDGRIEHGFRARFRALAKWTGEENADVEAGRLVREAIATAASEKTTPAQALASVWLRELGGAKQAWIERPGERAGAPPWARFDEANPPRFLCDPSLCGLARWLRAAGYEARLAPGVPGHRLPDEALRRGLVLLTSEAEVLDRRIVADGSLVVVWVPSALTMAEQLHLAAVELGLTLREARCMACGGGLVPTPKEAVRPRIPPRTALWQDEYFVCAECDHLFWRGTHWERIAATLRRTVAA